MDASEIHARRLNAKEVLTPKKWWKFDLPDRRWNSQIIPRRSGSEKIHRNPGTTQIEEKNKEIFQENQTGLLHHFKTHPPSDGEARNDFWSISGNDIYRHHVQPRVKLYVPREESFPIPLQYIDVTRATSTTSDVMFQRRIDDYWNTEWSRDLPDSWTGLTRFTILDENLQMGFHGLGGGWRSKRHPGLITCGQSSGKTCQKQRNEKQNKSGLPKNRSLTKLESCVVFTSLIQRMLEFQVTFQKNARRKLEVPMPAAMPCKTKGVKGKLVALLMLAKQNTHASLKPTNLRERVWKTLSTKIMKTTLQGKRINSLKHYDLVHKLNPMPKSKENTRCESSSGQRMGKTRANTGMAARKSETKKEVIGSKESSISRH